MNNPEKTKVADRLKALLLGAAAVTAVQSSSAAQVAPAPQQGPGSLEARVEKVRQQLNENPAAGEIRTGNGNPGDAELFWWRNAWGNGGGGGWHNWGNGGWHNWHNGWGNWHNF